MSSEDIVEMSRQVEEVDVEHLQKLSPESLESFRQQLTKIRGNIHFEKIKIVEAAFKKQLEIIEEIFRGGSTHEYKKREAETLQFILQELKRMYADLHFCIPFHFLPTDPTEAAIWENIEAITLLERYLLQKTSQIHRVFQPLSEIWTKSECSESFRPAFTHLEQMYLIKPHRGAFHAESRNFKGIEEIILKVLEKKA